MSNESLKEALMTAYKAWETHQRTTVDEFKKGELLWEHYVYCRNRWSHYSYYSSSSDFN